MGFNRLGKTLTEFNVKPRGKISSNLQVMTFSSLTPPLEEAVWGHHSLLYIIDM
jgi:hypothetical protein